MAIKTNEMKHNGLWALILAAAALIQGCATDEGIIDPRPRRIEAGDRVRVVTYYETTVGPDGTVSIPTIGSISVTGRMPNAVSLDATRLMLNTVTGANIHVSISQK